MKIFIVALLLAIGYAQTDCNKCKRDFLADADAQFPKKWCDCLQKQNLDKHETCRAYIPISCGDKGECNSEIFNACKQYVPGIRHDMHRSYNIGLLDLFADCDECVDDLSLDANGIFPWAWCKCLDLQNRNTKETCRAALPRSCGATTMCDSNIFGACKQYVPGIQFDNSRTYNMGIEDLVIDCHKCSDDFMKDLYYKNACTCLGKQIKSREENCQAVVPESCGDVDMCNPFIFDACNYDWDNSQHFNIGPVERPFDFTSADARSGSTWNLQSPRSHQKEAEKTLQLGYTSIIFFGLGILALIILAIAFCWYVQQREHAGLKHNLLLDDAISKEENKVSEI